MLQRDRAILISFPNRKYLAAWYGIAPEILPLYDEISQTLATFINAHYPAYLRYDLQRCVLR